MKIVGNKLILKDKFDSIYRIPLNDILCLSGREDTLEIIFLDDSEIEIFLEEEVKVQVYDMIMSYWENQETSDSLRKEFEQLQVQLDKVLEML